MNFGQPRRGQEHPLAGTSNAHARALRAKYRVGETSLRDLARDANLSYSTVRRIVRKLTYTDDDVIP